MKKKKMKRLIRNLQKQLAQEEQKADNAICEANRVKQRLMMAGIKAGEIKTIVPSVTGMVRAKAWGQYMPVSDFALIESAKEELVQALAKSLIEENIVQFIVKVGADKDDPLAPDTVGAKLYCVPWEEA